MTQSGGPSLTSLTSSSPASLSPWASATSGGSPTSATRTEGVSKVAALSAFLVQAPFYSFTSSPCLLAAFQSSSRYPTAYFLTSWNHVFVSRRWRLGSTWAPEAWPWWASSCPSSRWGGGARYTASAPGGRLRHHDHRLLAGHLLLHHHLLDSLLSHHDLHPHPGTSLEELRYVPDIGVLLKANQATFWPPVWPDLTDRAKMGKCW